ncbi:MAG: hypothetical protein LBK13_05865 [Spirochaetales bacterium]|jgi:hypothetical protein|nr:hypothetical protein [Spirochaetales bacterium]
MAKTQVQGKQITFSPSAAVSAMLEEAGRLYGLEASAVITGIVEENLPKWMQKRHIKNAFDKAAEKIKGEPGPDHVLLKQDEVDEAFRLMSSSSLHPAERER